MSEPKRSSEIGVRASAAGIEVATQWVESLPIVNEFLHRIRLREYLQQYLPRPAKTPKVEYADVVLTLVRNILLCREPMYGVDEWAKRYAPDLLGLTSSQIQALNDDRVGRCLDEIFQSDYSSLVIAVSTHVVKEFGISLEEFHNDSTTVSFVGQYEEASEPAEKFGKRTLAIKKGKSKDHRPDLKQLLFILTTSHDEGVPLYFNAADGNTSDAKTHIESWEFLGQLSGRRDFLYVADSKLASAENMDYIHQRGGRFLTVLPRTFRREWKGFEELVFAAKVVFKPTLQKEGSSSKEPDICHVVHQSVTPSGYRVVWYYSSRKKAADAAAREASLKRMKRSLLRLKDRLASPKTRYRDHERVKRIASQIVGRTMAKNLLEVEILSSADPSRQKRDRLRFDIQWTANIQKMEERSKTDGFFPLVTNDTKMSSQDLLQAHKRQPVIEKRFSQLKSDLQVAPVFLKEVSRVEGLLCAYYFAMLIQVLVQRELRRAMREQGISSLPLYYENRPSKRPSSTLIFRNFVGILRHTVRHGSQIREMVTELNETQRGVLALFGLSIDHYGRAQTRTHNCGK